MYVSCIVSNVKKISLVRSFKLSVHKNNRMPGVNIPKRFYVNKRKEKYIYANLTEGVVRNLMMYGKFLKAKFIQLVYMHLELD